MEIILGATKMHLKNKAIIMRSQHGFICNLFSYDKVTCLVDEVKAVPVIFLDFSKTFDTVSHNTLPGKLPNCEINRFSLCEELAHNTKLEDAVDSLEG